MTEQEIEELKRKMAVENFKYLAWLANAVHTQYHMNDSDGFEQGDWRKCPHPVCLSVYGTARQFGIEPTPSGFDNPMKSAEEQAA
jgi:hypothetical protein